MKYSRRTLLQTAVASGCASLLSPASASLNSFADAANLGFSLYGMKSVPLADSLRHCAMIGYQHVEFCLNEGYPTAPQVFHGEILEQTKALLKELHLDVPCLMVLMQLTADDREHATALEQIRLAARMALQLNPEKPPLLETVVGGRPALWEEQKTDMVRRLRDWAAAAEDAGVRIAIKAHVGSAMNSPERLLWMLEQVPSPALTAAYDFSHFELQGLDLEKTLLTTLPRTSFIHVKDTTGDEKKFRFLLPGEGRTDYVRYFRLLRQHKYEGPVCVEVSGQVFSQPGYDPLQAARSCWDALSAADAKARGQA